MKKIIFIAGGDRTGKSTLCRKFIDNGFKYVHFNPPSGSPYREYLDFYDRVKRSPDANWVVDRYIWCEYAYSRHYGRISDCSLSRIRAIETKFLDFDSQLIYCENNLDLNWDLIAKEGKNEFNSKFELEKLRVWYEQSFTDTVLPFYKYDFSAGDTPDEFFNNVFQHKMFK